MSALRTQVTGALTGVTGGKKVLFVDLPTDYKGAGMLTRPQYLQLLAREPFATRDRSGEVLTIEPLLSGSHDFIWPRHFKDLLSDASVCQVLIWDKAAGSFVKRANSTGSDSYSFQATRHNAASTTVEPPDARLSSADKWKVLSEQASCISAFPNFMRIFPGRQAVTVYLPAVNIDPLKATVVSANIDFQSNTGCHGCFGGKLEIVWEGLDNTDKPICGVATIKDGKFGRFLVWLGRYRSWTLARRITRLGLRCQPGEYFADLYNLNVISDEMTVPAASLIWQNSGQTPPPCDLLRISKETPLSIQYDVSKIPQATGAQLVITKPFTTFDASVGKDVQSIDPPSGDIVSLMEAETSDTSGTMPLPDSVYESAGLHQVRVNALDRQGNIIGLPGEPLSIFSKPEGSSAIPGRKAEDGASNPP